MSGRDSVTVYAARELAAALTDFADGKPFDLDALHSLRNQLTFVRVCVRDEVEATIADAVAAQAVTR